MNISKSPVITYPRIFIRIHWDKVEASYTSILPPHHVLTIDENSWGQSNKANLARFVLLASLPGVQTRDMGHCVRVNTCEFPNIDFKTKEHWLSSYRFISFYYFCDHEGFLIIIYKCMKHSSLASIYHFNPVLKLWTHRVLRTKNLSPKSEDACLLP